MLHIPLRRIKQGQIISRIFILSVTACIWIACKNNKPKENYLLDELDLVPEGIAYYSKQHKFFLTSIAKSKIITVDL
ncbi:MAG: hypothetical protein AAF361_14375, partial [Bacteroidota bacterium]